MSDTTTHVERLLILGSVTSIRNSRNDECSIEVGYKSPHLIYTLQSRDVGPFGYRDWLCGDKMHLEDAKRFQFVAHQSSETKASHFSNLEHNDLQKLHEEDIIGAKESLHCVMYEICRNLAARVNL